MLRLSPKTAIESSETGSPTDEATLEVDGDGVRDSTRGDSWPEPDAQAEPERTTTVEQAPEPDDRHQQRSLTRIAARSVLPAVALTLTLAAAWLKWQTASTSEIAQARIGSVQAASESTVALLSYKPETVDKDLAAARERLTGQFRDSYTSLTHDVVAPGAKQKQISALANVPAAASISAAPSHAVVLVFVNQTTTIGDDAPTNTASSVRVTLDKIDNRWLISGFDPV